MDIKLSLNLNIVVDKPKLKDILKAFVKIVNPALQQIVTQVVAYYANLYFENGKLCKMLHAKRITRKSFTGNKTTVLLTPFGRIDAPQYQVKIDGHRKSYITRLILGIDKWIRIPKITVKYLGLMGALAPPSCCEQVYGAFYGNQGFINDNSPIYASVCAEDPAWCQ